MRRRRVLAEHLAVGFKRGNWTVMLELDGLYRLMCKLGLHFMHQSFSRFMWTCCCGRNFMLGEELPL